MTLLYYCLLYTSDAADEEDSVDLGGRRIIKNTGHGSIVIGRFHTRARLETDYPSETSLCTVAPFRLPDRHPFSDFFSEGRGWLYTGYLERIIPSSKLKDKVRRIVHSKLKLFHFQIKTYLPIWRESSNG